jgi:hypothetical protein
LLLLFCISLGLWVGAGAGAATAGAGFGTSHCRFTVLVGRWRVDVELDIFGLGELAQEALGAFGLEGSDKRFFLLADIDSCWAMTIVLTGG